MIPRLPEEDEGEFYRLLPEGVYDGWDGDGDPIGAKQGLGGLDANRQYPRGCLSYQAAKQPLLMHQQYRGVLCSSVLYRNCTLP